MINSCIDRIEKNPHTDITESKTSIIKVSSIIIYYIVVGHIFIIIIVLLKYEKGS